MLNRVILLKTGGENCSIFDTSVAAAKTLSRMSGQELFKSSTVWKEQVTTSWQPLPDLSDQLYSRSAVQRTANDGGGQLRGTFQVPQKPPLQDEVQMAYF